MAKEDLNTNAFRIVRALTGEDEAEDAQESTPTDVAEALNDDDLRKKMMREMGSRGGKKGGKARANAFRES